MFSDWIWGQLPRTEVSQAWYSKPRQEPTAEEVAGPKVGPAVVALLNGDAVKLSKDFIYTQSSRMLSMSIKKLLWYRE